MIKNLPLYLYGSIIIFGGLLLFLFKSISFQALSYTLGISLLIGSILAFLTAFSRRRNQVQFAYHEMHALGMSVFSLFVIFFCDTLDRLIYLTTFILFFSSFSEIIFCNWLFNTGKKVFYKILFIRLILGAITGIGTIISMQYTKTNVDWSMNIFGLLFILIGINIILYVPIIISEHMNEVEDISKEILK